MPYFGYFDSHPARGFTSKNVFCLGSPSRINTQLTSESINVDPLSIELIFNSDLYRRLKFDYTQENLDVLKRYLAKRFKVNVYCVGCKAERIFECEPSGNSLGANRNPVTTAFVGELTKRMVTLEDQFSVTYGYISTPMRCVFDSTHKMYVQHLVQPQSILKIGQYPSQVDLKVADFKKYEKVLGEEKNREFVSSRVLHSHGFAIGAFIYLRRIFEWLLDQAEERMSKRADWDEELYKNARVAEKVELLKDELPPHLVKNVLAYRILSTGVHNLKEIECEQYYEVLFNAVETMISQELSRRDALRLEEESGLALRAINQLIKKSPDS